eukprot:CAMPEP_0182934230 /NCGR_PEP_ID=MMETSP0105_2-20130417/35726_1 /TAXON_ID=81532 ORGANISM="Acanthoeca-like sp., Strain 10tr" /NCGR_SAMPLE_ID=MMETSP0105_2 /ASSEMBLY_ACC=CAM_ASM_000205 /LENGTH=68 /DNA_ID=CAMNT_0025073057 /DNA_START=612 /DNA_END=818 /DNA_ORIENTATION=+
MTSLAEAKRDVLRALPMPVRSRSNKAVMMALWAFRPAVISTMDTPTRAGDPGGPDVAHSPASACTSKS